ncbi:phospholipase D-like domain-containing protein [Metapseudomonas otitidis]|uniref:phospholipase D-like domain-containing protein n=1 Tax=Metapseudomonas otitidis TaxID=319939 RepID=UPI00280AF7E7|nr:phospholipase D-like domain-containing protein [Pseudomonas otitidis]
MGRQPYNGIRDKELNQINTESGKAYAAYSAPDFFISQAAFAPKRSGNQVRFFTTGQDYYHDLAKAIDGASQCVFITGWQVNYDVQLDGKRSLWQCLRQALERAPTLKVYVMPWLSPSGSLGTYDFETLLAMLHLNAGLPGAPRAFCTPAVQQSDMKGLGVAFSHHQKSVVIDNRIGYVGGIDLAYGRRDDNDFSLDASTRRGNDAYNPGLPKLGWMAMHQHVSSLGLIMATLFDLSKPAVHVRTRPYQGLVARPPFWVSLLGLPSRASTLNGAARVADFFSSPMLEPIDYLRRARNSLNEALGEVRDGIMDARRKVTINLIRAVANLILDHLNDVIDPAFKAELREWIDSLRLNTLNLSEELYFRSLLLIERWMSETELGQVFTLVAGKSFKDLPERFVKPTSELAIGSFWLLHGLLQSSAGENLKPYKFLHEAPQPLASADYGTLAADQPRMPWQDVHSRIEGPSVYDLSRNFIDRWNSQQAHLNDTPAVQDSAVGRKARKAVSAIMTWLNDLAEAIGVPAHLPPDALSDIAPPKPQPHWINADLLPQAPAQASGGMSVQVLRSASARLTQQELRGRQLAGVRHELPLGLAELGVQDNCLRAMLQAVSSAQHFLYVENQFFQSAFGEEGELGDDQIDAFSGPMATLRDPRSLPQELVERVRLNQALAQQDIWQLDWAELERIAREPGKEAKAFIEGVKRMLANNGQGWASSRLGPPQNGLLNRLGEALAARIGRAIDEGRPFHVYLVLPVHPEGTLDTLNILHQIHLTQQSLLFGEHSLVRTIQRRMALKAMLERKIERQEALDAIEREDPSGEPFYARQDWRRYLTLLNLRTWAELGGRVVTEQIYVHSKLLIADDRVAILGSANINDRSLLGGRDSELAVIVRDSSPKTVALDGEKPQVVSQAIHQLRVALWTKHFGLAQSRPGPVQPASALASVLDKPAARSTWEAIQQAAEENAKAYERAFDFIPQSSSPVQTQLTPDLPPEYKNGFPCSVWPTWAYRDALRRDRGGKQLHLLPHEPAFWRSETLQDVRSFSAPEGIRGFITALPTNWTQGERNHSGLHFSAIARNGSAPTPRLNPTPTPPKATT